MAINGWRLIEQIGSGGMGVVWRAEHPRHGVGALKLLREDRLGDPAARARFRREATALQQVDGLCTGRVLDVQVEGDSPYIVTEYVAGPTLIAYIAENGPLTGDVLRAFAMGMAEALVAVHQAGVVHRDLSPTNVLMAADGPKVVDFGIARYADAATVTVTGMAIGTPGWMSPEQLRGHEAGPAADMFCWALLVCYATTGRNPFGEGPTDALLYRIVHEPPSVPPLPASLESLVTRALAKEPFQRPSALHVLKAIERDAGAPMASVLQQTWQGPASALAPEDAPQVAHRAPPQPVSATSISGSAPPEPFGPPPEPFGAPPGLAAGPGAPGRRRSRSWIWGLAGIAAVAVVAAVLLSNQGRNDGTASGDPSATQTASPVKLTGSTEPAQPTAVPTSPPTTDTALPPPPAPWDAEPVEPPTVYLSDVAQEWASKPLSCDLYAPIAVESVADVRSGLPIERPDPEWFWYGWTNAEPGQETADADHARVFISPRDDPPGVLDLYLDSGEEPREYRDGSRMYFTGTGREFGRLIEIAGQDCFYELRASDEVILGWMLSSLRPIIVEE